MSRREEYTLETATALCEQIAQVGSVGKACASVGVSRSTFYTWKASHPEFHVAYVAAKEEYADALFDELEVLTNADPPKADDGCIDKAWPQLQRVKLEAIKYRLRCLMPKRYSDRLELVGVEGAPLIPKDELTPERMLEGARRMAFALHRADAMMREKAPAPLLLVHEVKAKA